MHDAYAVEVTTKAVGVQNALTRLYMAVAEKLDQVRAQGLTRSPTVFTIIEGLADYNRMHESYQTTYLEFLGAHHTLVRIHALVKRQEGQCPVELRELENLAIRERHTSGQVMLKLAEEMAPPIDRKMHEMRAMPLEPVPPSPRPHTLSQLHPKLTRPVAAPRHDTDFFPHNALSAPEPRQHTKFSPQWWEIDGSLESVPDFVLKPPTPSLPTGKADKQWAPPPPGSQSSYLDAAAVQKQDASPCPLEMYFGADNGWLKDALKPKPFGLSVQPSQPGACSKQPKWADELEKLQASGRPDIPRKPEQLRSKPGPKPKQHGFNRGRYNMTF
ncbi:uncharacterized protein J3D65DRAFT_601822 [Phyllosticta citribraziliensis]|uniref:Uncharacterized protein n=1 Tax=Phyllosticta citribraziliensis TaxID=989973 RepID=A0ABR1LX96_9PEZI